MHLLNVSSLGISFKIPSNHSWALANERIFLQLERTKAVIQTVPKAESRVITIPHDIWLYIFKMHNLAIEIPAIICAAASHQKRMEPYCSHFDCPYWKTPSWSLKMVHMAMHVSMLVCQYPYPCPLLENQEKGLLPPCWKKCLLWWWGTVIIRCLVQQVNAQE